LDRDVNNEQNHGTSSNTTRGPPFYSDRINAPFTLERLRFERGLPQRIFCDNAPSSSARRWIAGPTRTASSSISVVAGIVRSMPSDDDAFGRSLDQVMNGTQRRLEVACGLAEHLVVEFAFGDVHVLLNDRACQLELVRRQRPERSR